MQRDTGWYRQYVRSPAYAQGWWSSGWILEHPCNKFQEFIRNLVSSGQFPGACSYRSYKAHNPLPHKLRRDSQTHLENIGSARSEGDFVIVKIRSFLLILIKNFTIPFWRKARCVAPRTLFENCFAFLNLSWTERSRNLSNSDGAINWQLMILKDNHHSCKSLNGFHSQA